MPRRSQFREKIEGCEFFKCLEWPDRVPAVKCSDQITSRDLSGRASRPRSTTRQRSRAGGGGGRAAGRGPRIAGSRGAGRCRPGHGLGYLYILCSIEQAHAHHHRGVSWDVRRRIAPAICDDTHRRKTGWGQWATESRTESGAEEGVGVQMPAYTANDHATQRDTGGPGRKFLVVIDDSGSGGRRVLAAIALPRDEEACEEHSTPQHKIHALFLALVISLESSLQVESNSQASRSRACAGRRTGGRGPQLREDLEELGEQGPQAGPDGSLVDDRLSLVGLPPPPAAATQRSHGHY